MIVTWGFDDTLLGAADGPIAPRVHVARASRRSSAAGLGVSIRPGPGAPGTPAPRRESAQGPSARRLARQPPSAPHGTRRDAGWGPRGVPSPSPVRRLVN